MSELNVCVWTIEVWISDFLLYLEKYKMVSLVELINTTGISAVQKIKTLYTYLGSLQ